MQIRNLLALVLSAIAIFSANILMSTANAALPADLANAASGKASAPATTATSKTAETVPVSNATQALPPVDEAGVDALAHPVFGARLFKGYFRQQPALTFNPNYQISLGDQIVVRMWGAYEYDQTLVVDPRGNIFIQGVGPIYVLGVSNQNLNKIIEQHIRKVYRSNVGVYATLQTAQPVNIYVTGFVNYPGLYSGMSSDSVLSFLDRAGGIDSNRGSYLDVMVQRNGVPRKTINLYDFLLNGDLPQVQFSDGDTVVVTPRKHSVFITGEVFNPYAFEFEQSEIALDKILSMAKAKPSATHVSILRRQGMMTTSEYYYLNNAQNVMIKDGDEVTVLADKYPGTIIVRVAGAHSGEHALVLPYGATLDDALKKIIINPLSNLSAIQLSRQSVANRQKEMLMRSLRALEAQALTASSATTSEAELRKIESQQILEFIKRAEQVQPKGLVVLGGPEIYRNTLLQDGDVIIIPEKSSLVMVHGEVLFGNAMLYKPGATAEDYIQLAGGYTQNADRARLVVTHPDGSAEAALPETEIKPGDEIMVLMKIDTKSIEITQSITTILYQIALSAKVLLGL